MNFNFANYKTKSTITLIGVIWAGSSALLSKVWGYGFLQGIGPTVIVSALFALYDKYLWRLPVFSFLNTVPDIGGKYTGQIVFHYGGENSEKGCAMSIKQSCSHIKVTCEFARDGENPTRSASKEALITTDASGSQELVFVYENEGSNMGGDTLARHQGTNVLRISKEDEKTRLHGFYYTNRTPQTKGKIEVLQQKTK